MHNKALITLILTLLSPLANAAFVDLQWTTTAQNLTGAIPGSVGEQLTTTLVVDNGGASLLSQSWSITDFVSYRVEGASGWFIESSDLSFLSGSGLFATDALGNVVSAGQWFGGYPNASLTTSWAGIVTGGWWNNGNNEVTCTANAADCVFANNVSGNLIGSNWSASLASSSVPEPATIALMGLGFASMAARRRKSV